MSTSVIENQWVIILHRKQDNKNKDELLVGENKIRDVISIKYQLLLMLKKQLPLLICPDFSFLECNYESI